MGDVTGLAILGSTGSIGRQALDVVRALPDHLRVTALACRSDVEQLEAQLAEHRPAAVWAEAPPPGWMPPAGGTVDVAPLDELVVRDDVDVVLVATTALAGLTPTLAALRAGKKVAIANKEVLVVAGAEVRRALAEGEPAGAELRPVDSEHSAIWQCLWGERAESVEQLTLTASGGAFRDLAPGELARVTPEQALAHPTWSMGRKVTVDSATLFNKGLEAIEARWLFDVPLSRIDIVQHRESVVHSMVRFVDGSVKAQLGEPDMRLPIQCALTYPERLPARHVAPLDLAVAGRLHFEAVDHERFPALGLALEAGRRADGSAAALSGADESAVAHFLAGRLGFTEIARLLRSALDAHEPVAEDDLDALLGAEAWGRRFVDRAVDGRDPGRPAATPAGDRVGGRDERLGT
ncbi:MAG: 1-deoxy-D-xylulose-5-phosphate reductoisomerase [Chloroflexi bacterium]|nr:1-deoxy-D-xylulose-5-phosphate reductoisomerase [Chloroflexota bacterium]